MPGQARNGRRRSRRGEGVKNGKGGLQGRNQDGAIEVAGVALVMVADGRMFAYTHPMAKVLQSAAGAKAVIGSKIVLAERCSDVEGSNKMMLPWAFPGSRLVPNQAMATWPWVV